MNRSIFDILNDSDHLSAVISYVQNIYYQISDFFSFQTLLPPLLMLIAIYLTLLSLYRTTTLLLRTTLFLVKWGGIIAIIAAAIGYFSQGSHSLSSSNSRRHRTSKPRIWDTFAEHQRWRNDELRPKDITDMIYEIVDAVADVTQQFAQQGWRQTLSRLALRAITTDPQDNPRKSSRWAKGKAKSR